MTKHKTFMTDKQKVKLNICKYKTIKLIETQIHKVCQFFKLNKRVVRKTSSFKIG